jgi:hypothetical protein
MLSQALYWNKRTNDPDRWFYKTQEEWEDETGLNRRTQEVAREQMRKSGVLEEKLSGMPAKLHFRVNFDVLTSWYTKNEANLVQNSRTNKSVQENQVQNEAKNSVQPLYTENTTENTTKEKINKKENQQEDKMINSSSIGNSIIQSSENSSKNSVCPMTALDRWEMAKELDVPLWVIKQTEKNFWDYIETPKGSKKGYKTTYKTVKKWIEMKLQKGELQNCNETEKLQLDMQHPDIIKQRDELFAWAKEQKITE